jgi:hypothetical protein
MRWHGSLEREATFLSLAESQLALAALASLCVGERDSVQVLQRLLRRVTPYERPESVSIAILLTTLDGLALDRPKAPAARVLKLRGARRIGK